jgi:hypothetical protein
VSGPGLGDEPTHAGQPGVGGPPSDQPHPTAPHPTVGKPTSEYPIINDPAGAEARTTWIGRARPPANPVAAHPVDPYWPPLGQAEYGHAAAHHPVALVRPRRSSRATFMLVVGLIAAFCVVGSLLVLLGSALIKNSGTTTGAASPPTPSPTTPAPPPEPGVGDAVRDGRFEFVVSKVQCGKKRVEAGFFNATAQGQFCVVDFSVRNIGDEAQNFSDLFQRAYDTDGAQYSANVQADLIVNKDADAFWKSVDPGNSMAGKLVFDIPRKAELAQIELHDSPFSSGAVVTV